MSLSLSPLLCLFLFFCPFSPLSTPLNWPAFSSQLFAELWSLPFSNWHASREAYLLWSHFCWNAYILHVHTSLNINSSFDHYFVKLVFTHLKETTIIVPLYETSHNWINSCWLIMKSLIIHFIEKLSNFTSLFLSSITYHNSLSQ